ncbi:MAG: HAMP domain-containing histidine kinase [Planctomycetes bacterium]|nr:HAMP domain-containing histidine kinase [Planctomycetota bacterium]
MRKRIVLPFVGLFTAVYAATVGATLAVVTRSVEDTLKERVRSLAELVREVAGVTSSPTYARYLRTVYHAEVAVFKENRLTAFCSLPASEAEELGRREFWPPEDTFVPWKGYLALRNGGAFLLYPANVLDVEKRAVVRPLVAIAAVGLIVVALLGAVIGHSISRPIETLAARARGLTDRPGDSLPYIGGGREIADLIDALNRTLEALRRSERLAVLGHVAAGIAHEIKNPLSAMKMTVQMLREEKRGKEREPYDLLLREIERLDLAASEFSAAARPSPPAKESAALDLAVGEVLDLLARQLTHLGIRVERRFESLPSVPVDVNRFKRAAMNLILNGADAMPQGGTLTVSLSAHDSWVRFAVGDTGRGVPQDLRDRIFEPFVTGKEDGVGLGLALTKRIVEDHGGEMGFQTSDRGSTFWIDLPWKSA